MAIERSSNAVVEKGLDQLARKIERRLDGNVLAFAGDLRFGIDDAFRDAIDSINNKKEKLIVLLETPGGYAEVVQRIADTMRKKFSIVDFVVPNYALSAGTILVMSGDAIYMDDYSILGPIDPQVENRNGQMVPALGYLKRYEELIAKSAAGTLTTAELAILIDSFDQAELYQYEQAKKLSETLLKGWLVKYKFKDWSTTRSQNKKVTKQMKENRATEIANHLQDTDKWHTHGRGISKDVLEKEINLLIDDFSEDDAINKSIRDYWQLFSDYSGRRGLMSAIHTYGSFVSLERKSG